ncbi:alpha/beta hydrolase [Robertkochia flava]|uniref:alpha/beta hydrolase n=1 Tax=Robertkochia flava TaxID=3447986 RepID=UPI001CCBD34F|nr:alpha/beta hydrolase [Robertkochia marina]
MRSVLLFILTLFCGHLLSAQKILKDPVYNNINRLTMTYADTLKTDIYYAPGSRSVHKSPLVLLVHGGGFYTGKRNGELETAFAMDLAGRGYVVASMEYHLSRKGKKEGFGCNCPAGEKRETFRQAVVNIDEALDYLLKFSKEFNFDPEKVILAGSSAGAEAILHAAYAGNHESFKDIMDNHNSIAAVISFAGALISEVEIDKVHSVPAFLVHGTDDKLVPYHTAPHHYCGEDAPGYLSLDGSASIAEELKEHNTPYVFITAEGGGHEWANKGYALTDEISAFLYDLLIRENAGQVNQTIPSQP